MSRRYKPNAASEHFVYSVEDVMELYGVSRNTVSNWRRHELNASDGKTPLLFRGAELNRFHRERRARSRTCLRPGEFKCFACKAASFPDPSAMRFTPTKSGRTLAYATCPDCAAAVQKILSETECDMLRKRASPNTTESSLDELCAPIPGDIGNAASSVLEMYSENDRILHLWQGWAGRFTKQTRAAHMAAIRDFEKHLNGKVFAHITPEDAAFYREELMDRSRKPKEDGGLSRSTLTHRASYVASFFEWLSKQSGHRHLAKLDGWFDLPKGFRAKADEKPAKQYPALEEAERALATMPRSTLKDRRDRAIFAAAFATGLREDALITLRRKYIDPLARTARQVGAVMRAKNGKSYVAHWFPRTDAFQEVLCEWVQEVDALGLRGEDALFPPHGELVRIGRGGAAIPPMKTASAVGAVFIQAWKHSAETYTPHSARHTLARLGDSLCLTPEKRKAWSQNLGHETETITEQHYGKMSPAEQAEVFEGFENETSFSVDEMQLALDYLSRRLSSSSPHYEKARDLARRYEDGGRMR